MEKGGFIKLNDDDPERAVLGGDKSLRMVGDIHL